jgi:hypothetical protein
VLPELVYTIRFVVTILTAYFLPGHLIITSVRSRFKDLDGADTVLLSVSLSLLVTTSLLFFSSLVLVPFGTVVLLLSVLVICLEIWKCRVLSRRALHDTFAQLLARSRDYLRSLSRFEKILFAVLVYQLLISLMHAVYWPIFSWDSLGYWLYYGRAFYEEGTMNLTNHQLWIEIPANKGSGMAYPMIIPLLYAWLFTSVGGVDLLLANSVQVVFLLTLVLAVFQLFKRSDSGRVSFFACLFFLLFSAAIAVQWDVFKGETDFPLLVSNLTLMYFALRFWQSPSTTNALAAGVVGGLTGSIKQLGLVFAFLAGMLILLKSVFERRDRIISKATHFSVYAASALAFSVPYYVYSISQAPSETIAYWSPTISSAFNLTTFLEFTLAALHGVLTRAWGLSPVIALVGVVVAWRKIRIAKIVLFWMLGSLFVYYLVISTTELGSFEYTLKALSWPKYTLAIFSLFAVLAGSALGAFWQRRETEREPRRKIYSIIIVAVLVSNVAMNIGVMQSYLLPPFMNPNGALVNRTLEEKYTAKLGGFYEVAMYINHKTPPGSVIITIGYYRYFFFNARDQRKLYGMEERPGLWTNNLTKLKCELRNLESSYVYVVEEPWYAGFAPYDFYFQSALYIHRHEIMTMLLTTQDGYLLYQVSQEFVANDCVSACCSLSEVIACEPDLAQERCPSLRMS